MKYLKHTKRYKLIKYMSSSNFNIFLFAPDH